MGRINKVIELLEQGQPVFSTGAPELTYEAGKAMAGTWADLIMVEFEHHAFGKMDDSLGRGAKTIRTSYPDMLELILGLAGTLVVYSANGTKELRRIPHVIGLPMVRKRLNTILESTAITIDHFEDEEEEDE